MKVQHSHLSLAERRRIERWRHAKMSPDDMAHRLGRHRSTIFRELRRNHFHHSEVLRLSDYWCIVAQSLSDGRRKRQRKLMRESHLRDQVERCLRACCPPPRADPLPHAPRASTDPGLPRDHLPAYLLRGRPPGRLVTPPALWPPAPPRLSAAQAPAAGICF